MGEVETRIITTVAPLLLLAGVAVWLIVRVRRSASSRSLAVSWPHTKGTVLSATVQVSHNGTSRHESPLVLYAYQVNGKMFQGHRVRFGDEYGRTGIAGTETSASSTVARYPSGASVVVYYDPSNPANSALER